MAYWRLNVGIPTVLQWNITDLKTRLRDIRTRLHIDLIGILPLREPRVLDNEARLADHVIYYRKPQSPDEQSRAFLFLRKDIQQTRVKLDMFSYVAAGYTAITMTISGVDFTTVSMYVLPAVTCNTRELIQVC